MTIDFDSNGVLSRKEREELVLDLYFNQNNTIREITKIARMSPRDIKVIIDKAYQEKERQEHKSIFVQAYELFSQGKTPLQVSIILNIGATQVTHYYTEYPKLVEWDDVTKIYLEFKGEIGYFVNLRKAAKSAKITISKVINLLDIANNDLPSVQYEYRWFLEQLDEVKENKSKLEIEVDCLTNQIIVSSRSYQSTIQDCDKEAARLLQLQEQTKKQEAIVKHFKDDNAQVIKSIENRVKEFLCNKDALLRLALISLMESMRNSP